MTTVNSVGNGLSGATGTGLFVGSTAPTLSSLTVTGAASANNVVQSVTFTATASATTTLTAASTFDQTFTGTLNQQVNLPDATTLMPGWGFNFNNNSTGLITVKAHDGTTTICTVVAGGDTWAFNLTNGTTNGTWDSHNYLSSLSTSGTGGLSTPYPIIVGNASTISTNGIMKALNYFAGYNTFTTSQTLTVLSPYSIYMTGSTAAQVMTLPVVSTYSAAGASFSFVNNSSVSWAINSSGGNLVVTLPASSSVVVDCILITGTTAASWNALPIGNSGGAVLLAPAGVQTITNYDLVINTLTVGLGSGSIPTSTAFGVNALASCTAGSGLNTAIGWSALGSNTTGNNNTAVGYAALLNVVTSINNTAVGRTALSLCTGAGNTGIGVDVLSLLTTGDDNIALGFLAGSGGGIGTGITTGTDNTFLGVLANANADDAVGVLAIGRNALANKATGATSGDNGPGIAIGSSLYPVGFRGDGTIYPSTSGAGFWQPVINGTAYCVPLYASGSTNTGSVLLAPSGPQTITGFGLTAPSINFGGSSLSSYEENTFTPIVTADTVGDLSVTYTIQEGVVTKIGRQVTVYVALQFTPTFTTASGAIRFGDLPYTVSALADGIGSVGNVSFSFTWPAGYTNISSTALHTTNYATLILSGTNISSTTMLMSNMLSGVLTNVIFQVTYFV